MNLNESSEDKLRKKTAVAMIKVLDGYVDDLNRMGSKFALSKKRIKTLGIDDSIKRSDATDSSFSDWRGSS